MNKVVDGQELKKLKMTSVPQAENSNRLQLEGKSFIEQLPSELLLKILKYLDVKSLAFSRLMNRKWNGMAREIIKSGDDVEIEFPCRNTEAGNRNTRIFGRAERAERSLENFIKCFSDSQSNSKGTLLYTRFYFNEVDASGFFEREEWLKFISYFGKSIKCLKMVANTGGRWLDEPLKFVDKLGNLLLTQLTNLEEFGLEFSISHSHETNTPLFSDTKTASSNKEKTFQLPHLKVLYLDENAFSHYTRIFTDLLRAAVNLQEIKPFHSSYSNKSIESLNLLKELGKLHCLKTVGFCLNEEFLNKIPDKSALPLPFKLKILKLDLKSHVFGINMFPEAVSVLLYKIFEANQDTLSDLTMTIHFDVFLPKLQLPKFNKLANLQIIHRERSARIKHISGSPGINLMDIFPALQILNSAVTWITFLPPGSASCVPTLKTLSISGRGLTQEDVVRISQVCPNLREFVIHDQDEPIRDFPKVGAAIWTHLTKLESLNLQIDVDNPTNAFPAVDSCFTGFSGENCILLYDLMIKAEDLSKKWRSQIEVSKPGLEAERTNPSILDLKDLKNLAVVLRSDGMVWVDEKTPVISKQLLTVSMEYAFKLMGQLNCKITTGKKTFF